MRVTSWLSARSAPRSALWAGPSDSRSSGGADDRVSAPGLQSRRQKVGHAIRPFSNCEAAEFRAQICARSATCGYGPCRRATDRPAGATVARSRAALPRTVVSKVCSRLPMPVSCGLPKLYQSLADGLNSPKSKKPATYVKGSVSSGTNWELA